MNAAFVRHLPPRRPSPLPSPASGRGRKTRQRGISMFIVMVILMLALILVLGGLSVANMNESIVGNQSDAQRAYGSAQALLDAAQRDIRLNGRYCDADLMGSEGTVMIMAGHPPAPKPVKCTLRFPRDMVDYGQMASGAPGLGKCGDDADPSIYAGVCLSSGPADPAFTSDKIGKTGNALQWTTDPNGARYAQFVAALDAGDTSDYGGGATTGNGATLAAGGMYWVEVFPYNVNSVALDGGDAPGVPDSAYPFVFRITALATGLKSGTLSVLRTYYTPYLMQ